MPFYQFTPYPKCFSALFRIVNDIDNIRNDIIIEFPFGIRNVSAKFLNMFLNSRFLGIHLAGLGFHWVSSYFQKKNLVFCMISIICSTTFCMFSFLFVSCRVQFEYVFAISSHASCFNHTVVKPRENRDELFVNQG